MGQTETATKATPDGLASAIYPLVPTRAARLRNRGVDRPSRPRSPVHAERFRSEGDVTGLLSGGIAGASLMPAHRVRAEAMTQSGEAVVSVSCGS